VDLLIDLLPRLAGQGLQIAVLGHGEPQYEAALRTLQQRYPDLLSVRIGYDETLAHRIEAGADFFLMPSRFEPCGLNQIYSLRYGTLPIVHATGGLQDTVQDHQPGRSGATGFKFEQANAEGLLSAMMRACAVYRDRPVFDLLRQHAMQQDFSWKLSSLHYVMLYRRACGDVPPVDPEPTAQAQPSRPRRK
jgi:starch synthase